MRRVEGWSGPAAVLGGALFFVSAVAQWFLDARLGDTRFYHSPLGHALYHSLGVPAYALLAVGLLGLYLRHAGSFKRLGRVGLLSTFALIALAAFLTLGAVLIEGAVLGRFAGALETFHAVVVPLAIGSMVSGSTASGVATFRARLLPRVASLLLIVGPVALVAVVLGGLAGWLRLPPEAAWSAGWAWLGYQLWSEGKR